jgi:hypothetical protein
MGSAEHDEAGRKYDEQCRNGSVCLGKCCLIRLPDRNIVYIPIRDMDDDPEDIVSVSQVLLKLKRSALDKGLGTIAFQLPFENMDHDTIANLIALIFDEAPYEVEVWN